jgi:pSer/pThr/pTyr-binding forkhead associated (FHA) protein
MVTFIEIIEGSQEGSRFKMEPGLVIGRTTGDILLKDAKVSSQHARVELDSRDQLVLLDLDSSNGLIIGGRRVKKIALLPGVTFEIGRTKFIVTLVEETQASEFSRIVTWRSFLADQLRDFNFRENSKAPQLEAFTPALKLQFIRGIQTDEEYILGYGPRQAGMDSLDIELQDEEAPKEAFELRPGPGMVEIKILAQGKVLLNNRTAKTEMLKEGDLISIGTTVIKVSYL